MNAMKKSWMRIFTRTIVMLITILIAKCAFIATYGLASTCQPDANASSTALAILSTD